MTLFDSEGKLIDKDALRSVNFSGNAMSIPKPVYIKDKKISAFLNEETGKLGGSITEHTSGRVDVNVQASSVKVGLNSEIGEN